MGVFTHHISVMAHRRRTASVILRRATEGSRKPKSNTLPFGDFLKASTTLKSGTTEFSLNSALKNLSNPSSSAIESDAAALVNNLATSRAEREAKQSKLDLLSSIGKSTIKSSYGAATATPSSSYSSASPVEEVMEEEEIGDFTHLQGHVQDEIQRVRLPRNASIADAAELMGCTPDRLLTCLATLVSEYNISVTPLSQDTLEHLADELGLAYEFDHDTCRVSRPPVVSVLGHVDHGKTTLLDALRGTTTKEHGNITQKVSAFPLYMPSCEKTITIFDTPGHSLFHNMRKDIARVSDVIVVIVAVDGGIQDQTEEVLALAQQVQVPVVVALNKVDVATDDQIQAVRHSIEKRVNLDVQVVEVSALRKTGLEDLEEAIALVYEVADLSTPVNAHAEGMALSQSLTDGIGGTWNVLIQAGTLKSGDVIVMEDSIGRCNLILDCDGAPTPQVGTSSAALVKIELLAGSGEGFIPGGKFYVVPDVKSARRELSYMTKLKLLLKRQAEPSTTSPEQEEASSAPSARFIVKSDSTETLSSLQQHMETLVKIFPSSSFQVIVDSLGVGNISQTDAERAKLVGAHVLGFNVSCLPGVEKFCSVHEVPLQTSELVYDLLDQVNVCFSS